MPYHNGSNHSPLDATDGQTFQREKITKWLKRRKRKSPLTGVILHNIIIHESISFKSGILELQEKYRCNFSRRNKTQLRCIKKGERK